MKRSSWSAIGVLLWMSGCESAPQAPQPLTPPPPGDDHFAAAGALHQAIVRGRLSDARDAAHALANAHVTEHTGWRPYVDDLRSAARRIEHTGDLAVAGAELGGLGRTCSTCHQVFDARPAFSIGSAPADDGTLASQGRRHEWAAARLWEGVTGPADASWAAGARVMAETELDLRTTVHEKPNADVFELGERLRDQGARAAGSRDRVERAVMYGEMMTACAGCHRIVRPEPVAPAQQPVARR